jgi:hypothetical protein
MAMSGRLEKELQNFFVPLQNPTARRVRTESATASMPETQIPREIATFSVMTSGC